MKKILLVVAVLLVAVAIFGVGFAFAQYQNVSAQGNTPFGHEMGMMGGRGGHGLVHDYVEQALAEKLGISEADVEAAFANGTTMYQLALDNGIAEADVATLLSEVHKTAFDKAVADGVMTQEQADLMFQRMDGNWENGTCTHTGQGFGRGMMGGRGGHGMMGGQQQQKNP